VEDGDTLLRSVIVAEVKRHRGPDAAIRRDELLYALREHRPLAGLSDRGMRAAIQKLRFSTRDGARICSTTSYPGGYYYAETNEQLEAFLRQDRHRAKELWQRANRQARAAGLKGKELQGMLF